MPKTLVSAVSAVVALLASAGCQLRQPRGPAAKVAGSSPRAVTVGPTVETTPLDYGGMRGLWSRGVAQANGAGFICDWLVCGEFPNPPRPGQRHYDHKPPCVGLDTDYLAEHGGDAGIEPLAGMEHRRTDGSVAVWTEFKSGDVLNFHHALKDRPKENAVVYAYARVEREEPGELTMTLGSDDGVRVWINGEMVHDNICSRGVRKDQDKVPVMLKQGVNHLLAKVENGGGGWGLAIRFLDNSSAEAIDEREPEPRLPEVEPMGAPVVTVETDAGLTQVFPGLSKVLVEATIDGTVAASRVVTRGEVVVFDSSSWPDGPYEIRVSRERPGPRFYQYLRGYKGDCATLAVALFDTADAAEDASDAASGCIAFLRELMRRRIGGDPREGKPGFKQLRPRDWGKVYDLLMEFQGWWSGGAPWAPGPVRIGWRDEVDGSFQAARAYLPPHYRTKDKWPMVVLLHGYNVGNPDLWGFVKNPKRLNEWVERHHIILLEPFGRGNTTYEGIGDDDVARAVRVATEVLNVDPARVYLMGISMGGAGTWLVGGKHPGLFAALGPVCGGWDYHTHMDAIRQGQLTGRARFFAEAGSHFSQAESLLSTPVFAHHGARDDLVQVDHARFAVRMLQRWGYDVRYREYPGGGHGPLGSHDELIEYFLQRRKTAHPAEVRLRAAWLKRASAHWVKVLQRQDPQRMIRVHARVEDRGTVHLATDNVLSVEISPDDSLVDRGRPLNVHWNDEVREVEPGTTGPIVLHAPGHVPRALEKRPHVAGPLRDLKRTPFAIVVGTVAEDPKMRRFCQLRAEICRGSWQTWQHTEPRFFVDTEITEEQVRSYSLALFGGPGANAVTRRLIGDVPLELTAESVTIDGQEFKGRDLSVSMLYPHPLNADRYVGIAAGTSPRAMYLTRGFNDSLDFVVTDGRLPEWGDEASLERLAVVSGFFDHNWRYNSSFAVFGDRRARVGAVRRKAPIHVTGALDQPRLMLSDLAEVHAGGRFTSVRRDKNWIGQPIRLGGAVHNSGLGVHIWHDPCFIVYDIEGGDWGRLRGTIGLETREGAELLGKEKGGTKAAFQVKGDGKVLYDSPVFQWDTPPSELDVDVDGVKKLELLVIRKADWHNAATSINWADLRLEKRVGEVAPPQIPGAE